MRYLFGFVLLFAFLGNALAQTPAPDYRNSNLPIEQRVADLLKRMTLEEKVEQLGGRHRPGILDTTGKFNDRNALEAFRALFGVDSKMSPHDAAVLRNAVQRYLVEKTRLGIPAIF
ncbi:MAG: beta-glucosidase, partial [Terriglobia bacterium]